MKYFSMQQMIKLLPYQHILIINSQEFSNQQKIFSLVQFTHRPIDPFQELSNIVSNTVQLQRQLAERGGGGGICLSDQESLVSFPRGSVNGAATPGAGSSSGGGGCGIIPHMNSQPPLGSTELGVTVGNVGNAAGAGSSGGQAGDRGSCSADSGVRGSSDRESGGATSVGGNLSDSTTDGKTLYLYFVSYPLCVYDGFENSNEDCLR